MTFYDLKHNEMEQTHLFYGINSLPWLILTEKQNTVTAEDLSLDELNKKLKLSAVKDSSD